MSYKIGKIDFLNDVEKKRLQNIGLVHFDQLLTRGSSPAQRVLLSQQTEIDLERIDKLVSISDFLRIKGVGIQLSKIFIERFKFNNIKDFEKYYESNSDFNTTIIQSFPDLQKYITKFILLLNEVRTLHPIVYYEEFSEVNFNEYYKNSLRVDWKRKLKTINRMTLIIAIPIMIVVIILIFSFFLKVWIRSFPSNDVITSLKSRFLYNFFLTYMSPLLVLVVLILLSSFYIYLVLYEYFIYRSKVILQPKIIRTIEHQKLYLSLKKSILSNKIKRNQIFIFRLLHGLIILLLPIVLLVDLSDPFRFVNYVLYVFLLLVLILFSKSIIEYYNKIKRIDSFNESGFKRVHFLDVLETVVILFFLYFFIVVYLPVIIYLIDTLIKHLLNPISFSNEVKFIQETSKSEFLTDYQKHSLIEKIINTYSICRSKYSISGYFGSYPPWLKELFSLVFTTSIPVIFIWFLFPYFKFFGIRKTIIILSVIITTYFSDKIIELQFRSLNIIFNKITILVSVIVISILVSMLIDYIQSVLFSNEVICSSCKSENDNTTKFCKNCGYRLI